MGGLPGIINEEVGALARPEDPESLAAAILDVLARTEQKGDAWRQDIADFVRKEYGQDVIIHELEEVYEQAIGQ